jgi:ribosomal protein S18 acetylase RimI-like enzyme
VTISIRAAVAADAPAIAEVHVDGWRWAYRGQLPDDAIDGVSVDSRREMWDEVLVGAGGVAVAERDGRIVGFAAFGPTESDDVPRASGELFALYLREGCQGQGIGRALLAAAEAGLRNDGSRRAVLWVLETNVLARRFYERAGWRWDGTRSEHRFDCAARPILRYAADL